MPVAETPQLTRAEAVRALADHLGEPLPALRACPIAGGWYFWPDPDVGGEFGSYLVGPDGLVRRRPSDEALDDMLGRLGPLG